MDQRSNGHSGGDELAGARILLVEDDPFILMELEAIVEDAGAAVIDACSDVGAALAAVDGAREIDAAVLDVRLRDESVAPVARQLGERRVPFVFYSGQSRTDSFYREWSDSLMVQKPAEARTIVLALAKALARRQA